VKFIDVGTKASPLWVNPDRVDYIEAGALSRGSQICFTGMREDHYVYCALTVDEVINRMKDGKYHILVTLYDIPKRIKNVHESEQGSQKNT